DVTIGGDRGPKGAAISDIGADADWQRLMRALYEQLDWGLNVGETGPGAPMPKDTVGCGVGPSPRAGYGLRAAMRDYMTPAMCRHAERVPTGQPANAYGE